MYFPFFRARQYELLALRDTIIKEHISKQNVKPIIEPVIEGTRDIFRFCDELEKVNMGFIFVVNPSKGYYVKNQKKILKLAGECINRNTNIEFAFRVDDGTPIKSIAQFVQDFAEFRVSLIHQSSIKEITELKDAINTDNFAYNVFLKEGTSKKYRSKFAEYENVILEDSFNKVEPNSAYEGEEFFNDTVFTYEERGYFGFGDYSIVGDHFSVGGGQARTCAIHITYEEDDEEIWVKHFLSEPRENVDDGSTLAAEAIEALVSFVEENWTEEQYTNAIKEFVELQESGRQTSLAFVKKLSMRHHLELIDGILG
ncbi:sce7725 family protein [Vibrio coralliilyticus]|uniref:Sce7725 family protein n=1 Tax=Vibrio coralliilyticus TaxID=190893 RepID=A0AAN0SFE4_9VIBR|nr:sce7725 family protein [Vibrio coralliilyticus]AIW21122.1 hypothetical protein IX92_19000 [Vibrio coralliilyticus]NOH40127.1 sce7725 family protein [Vibrio coralliilyticus]